MTVDWQNKIVHIEINDLKSVAQNIYELNPLDFKEKAQGFEASEEGILHDEIVEYKPPIYLDGATVPDVVEVVNGYTITFEDGQYAVNLKGANSNIAEVTNVNGVQVRSFNSTLVVGNNEWDTTAPLWDGTIGVTDVYQNGKYLNVRWGSASDDSGEVLYRVYISQAEATVWNESLVTTRSNFAAIDNDGYEPLQDGQTYYIGVRAVDPSGNEDDNNNIISIVYQDDTRIDDILTTVSELRHAAFGGWRVENNQMIFVKTDGSELARFNLFDENGVPTSDNVKRMVRV